MNQCIFCKIIKGEVPSNIVYQDEDFVIFTNIAPSSKYHYLAVPKEHYGLLADASTDQERVLGKMLLTIPKLAELLHLENGYRLIVNQGGDAGQEVHHLHIHILAGQKMEWHPV